MVIITQSLQKWLTDNHPDIISMIMFGHTELLTLEMQTAYLEWCKTEDGKKHLKGGSEYREDFE